MKRKIIKINTDKCNGCGLCASACHEGAIGLTNGKAILLREDYCDGLGDCLPACPTGAITFEEREASGYVRSQSAPDFPIQMKLVTALSPRFAGAHLLIAADCCAHMYANFYTEFIRGRTVIIGCPKLDGMDYSVKLAEIISGSDIKSVTVARMEVPCCGGIEYAASEALRASGKSLPFSVVTFTTDGKIKEGE
jgi:NAD-dependent dihydropyrimidine dehydrogenase PreA subunit